MRPIEGPKSFLIKECKKQHILTETPKLTKK